MNILFISLLPVVILLLYIYIKDVDKEPRGMLFLIFVFGCISTIPIAIVELILGIFFPSDSLPTFIGTLVSVFMTIAIIEEFGKWFITYVVCYRNKEYNHFYDGIVYAVFASLGFAAIENILYVLTSGFGAGIVRALLSVPSHAVDAVYMGYLLSISKKFLVNNKHEKSFIFLLLSILIPGITHAIYDALLFHFQSVESWYLIVLFLGFVLITYIIAIVLVNLASKEKVNFDGTVAKKAKVNFCPKCGNKVVNGSCTQCDFKDN